MRRFSKYLNPRIVTPSDEPQSPAARPGVPYPLGATWDGEGVNFALFSENATAVELCLFDGPQGNNEQSRVAVTEQSDQVWHIYLPGFRPSQRYGYRVHVALPLSVSHS